MRTLIGKNSAVVARLALVAACLTFALLLATGAATAQAAPAPIELGPKILRSPDPGGFPEFCTSAPMHLRASGRFLVNDCGKIVVLHGVNAVAKRTPYVPDATQLTAADVSNMAALGFNSVRLGIIWKGLEPCKVGSAGCSGYDERYLDRIAEIVEQLGSAGIYVLLDFHQDLYGDAQDLRCLTFFTCDFHGEGAPDWATNNDNKWIGPAIGGNLWGLEYLYPGVAAAFDHLINPANDWNDIQSHYRAAWRRVATRFANEQSVIGYDLMNEPWPGSILPWDAQAFDRNKLGPFYQSIINSVRTVDRWHTIFYEPNPLNNGGPPFTMPAEFNPRDPERNLALSYHIYCAVPGLEFLCNSSEALAMGTFNAEIRERGIAGYLTEFGATNNYDEIGYITDLADQHAQGWSYWQWKYWQDPTGMSGEEVAHVDGTLNQDKAAQLARTYPKAIAADSPGSTGREPSWCYSRHVIDPASQPQSPCADRRPGYFRLSYNANRIGSVTWIFVPVSAPLDGAHAIYPNGYRITSISGAHVVSSPNARSLGIRNDTEGNVSVELEPR